MVLVHSAGVSDSAGARLLLTRITGLFPRLTRIWADGTYRGTLLDWALELGAWIIDIVINEPDCPGFQVVPRRWGVERTFAWLGRFRRLSKDYEYLPASSEALIYLAMIRLMVARLAKTTTPQHFAAPTA
jgi:putative transposase